MFKNILQNKSTSAIKSKSASFVSHQTNQYLSSLQIDLDKQIDKRLERTFFDLFVVILLFRNRAMDLLLSELGGFQGPPTPHRLG